MEPTDKVIRVEKQFDLGSGYFATRFHWPELARASRAGQFVMIGVPDINEMLIRRPFSVARIAPEDQLDEAQSFDLLYKVVGRCTGTFSRLPVGAEAAVLGPLGRGFRVPEDKDTELIFVAGGIGNAPFPLFQQQLRGSHETTMIFGGRSQADLTLLDWFESNCSNVIAVTEDGSIGRTGRVTGPLAEHLDSSKKQAVFACGPHPMLKAVGELCIERGVACQLALEETMACGFGVCLGCVVEARDPATDFEKYVRVCTEGPVFEAREVVL